MSKNNGPQAILWVDLETTGSNEKFDDIIEIGAILSDFEFNTIDTFTRIVRPTESALARLQNNEVVLEMHTKNGLLDNIAEGDLNVLSIREVEASLLDWLWQNDIDPERPRSLILAGSGVSHFDKRFIAQHMPELILLLTHRTLDIGTVRYYLRTINVLGKGQYYEKNHRALDDIELHLNEAIRYRDIILNQASKAEVPYASEEEEARQESNVSASG